jgi:hypothetical protein
MKRIFISLFAIYGLFAVSCTTSDENCAEYPCSVPGGLPPRYTGWLAGEDLNDTGPVSVIDTSKNELPGSVTLENKFPPIGDQGQFGTCIAWAAGYNLKTSLNAIEKNWGSSDLLKVANQTSPKDLWLAIEPSKRGNNCQGTNFVYALDALVLKGAASMNLAPYNMGDCSGAAIGDPNNKLAAYRKIAHNNSLIGGNSSVGMTEDNFKAYLAQGKPILIGARLGDKFVRWYGSSVISSDTYEDSDMRDAHHAMVLVGYDDSKGAFRVRNAWGPDWGDNGSIWVEYDFLLERFVFIAYVADNK